MSITTRLTKQGIRDLDFGVARPKPAATVAPAPAEHVADPKPLPPEGSSVTIVEETIPAVTDGGAS